MRLQQRLELVEPDERIVGELELALLVFEMAGPEDAQRLPLAARLLKLLGATETRDIFRRLAIDEQIGRAVLRPGVQRLLELPFRAGDRRATVEPAIFAGRRAFRQRRAKPRPQDQHDNIGLAGWIDQILEVPGGEHRLVFPQHRRNLEETGEFALEPAHHQRRTPPLVADVPRRGDEDPERLPP